jgi:hypothetical protein
MDAPKVVVLVIVIFMIKQIVMSGLQEKIDSVGPEVQLVIPLVRELGTCRFVRLRTLSPFL